MFKVGLNVLIFPAMIFSVFNLRFGWRHWYRSWRNALVRFGGWIVYKNWSRAVRAGGFREKLHTVAGDGQDRAHPPPSATTQPGA